MSGRISHSILVLLVAASLVTAFPRPAKAMFQCEMMGELLLNCCCRALTSCCEESFQAGQNCCATNREEIPVAPGQSSYNQDRGCCNITIIEGAGVLPVLQNSREHYCVSSAGVLIHQTVASLSGHFSKRFTTHTNLAFRSPRPIYVLHQSFLI